jgi:hypothetical protein
MHRKPPASRLGYRAEYFLFGPDLPMNVIRQFREMAAFSGYLSAGDINDLTPGAKATIRSLRPNPMQAAEEFYKLALECGAAPSSAEIIRGSTRQVRV